MNPPPQIASPPLSRMDPSSSGNNHQQSAQQQPNYSQQQAALLLANAAAAAAGSTGGGLIDPALLGLPSSSTDTSQLPAAKSSRPDKEKLSSNPSSFDQLELLNRLYSNQSTMDAFAQQQQSIVTNHANPVNHLANPTMDTNSQHHQDQQRANNNNDQLVALQLLQHVLSAGSGAPSQSQSYLDQFMTSMLALTALQQQSVNSGNQQQPDGGQAAYAQQLMALATMASAVAAASSGSANDHAPQASIPPAQPTLPGGESFNNMLNFLSQSLVNNNSATTRSTGQQHHSNSTDGHHDNAAAPPPSRHHHSLSSSSRPDSTASFRSSLADNRSCSTTSQPITGRHRGRGRPPKSNNASRTLTNTNLKGNSTDFASYHHTSIEKLSNNTDTYLLSSRGHQHAPYHHHQSSSSSKNLSIDVRIERTIDDVLRRIAECPQGPAYAAYQLAQSTLGHSLSPARRRPSTSSSLSDYSNSDFKRVKQDDTAFNLPFAMGWRRETLVKGVGSAGILGEVSYVTPCGRRICNSEGIQEYLKICRITTLSVEDFTFKSHHRLGDYYEYNRNSQGNETVAKISDTTMDAIATFLSYEAASEQACDDQVKSTTANPVSTTITNTHPSDSSQSSCHQQPSHHHSSEQLLATSINNQSLLLNDHQQPPAAHSHNTLHNQTNNKSHEQYRSELPPSEYTTQSSVDTTKPPTMWTPVSRDNSDDVPVQHHNHHQQQRAHQHQQSPNASLNCPDPVKDRNLMKAFFVQLAREQRRMEAEQKAQRDKAMADERERTLSQKIREGIEAEMKQPVEDLRLINCKSLPVLEAIPDNRLTGQVFTDCLTVIEFLHAFTEILCIDSETIPSLGLFQSALIDRQQECLTAVLHVLIELLKFAILDPGLPSSRLVTQLLGQRFSHLEVDSNTVTGLLRVFLIGRNGYEDDMSDWLAPVALSPQPPHFNDLSGDKQAALLAFVCDELVGSSRLIASEVDRTIELQTNLKKEKWNLDCKLRRMRFYMMRKFGTPIMMPLGKSSTDVGDLHEPTTPSNTALARSNHDESRHSPPPYSEASDELVPRNDLDEYNSKHGRSNNNQVSAVSVASTMMTLNNDDELDSLDMPEFEERISALGQVVELKQRAIEECSHRLSGLFLGQDRYHRGYYVLGHLGGLYVRDSELCNTEQENGEPITKSSYHSNSVFDPDTIIAEIESRHVINSKRKYDMSSLSESGNSIHQPNQTAPTPQISLDEDQETPTPAHCKDVPPDLIKAETEVDQKLANEELNISFHQSNTQSPNPGRPASVPINFHSLNQDSFTVGRAVKSCADSPRQSSASSQRMTNELKQSNDDLFTEKVECHLDEPCKDTLDDNSCSVSCNKIDDECKTTGDESSIHNINRPSCSSSQPLDLSSKTKPSPHSDSVAIDSDGTIDITACKASTDDPSLRLDEPTLTTAVLLFMTHASIIPPYLTFNDTLADPWKTVIAYYKSLLTSTLIEERDQENNAADNIDSLGSAVLCLKSSMQAVASAVTGADDQAAANSNSSSSNPKETAIFETDIAKAIEAELEHRKIQLPASASHRIADHQNPSRGAGWCRLTNSLDLRRLSHSLASRGLRERVLVKAVKRSEEMIETSLKVASSIDFEFNAASQTNEEGWCPKLLRVRSRRGKGRGASISQQQPPQSINCHIGVNDYDDSAVSVADDSTTTSADDLDKPTKLVVENRLRKRAGNDSSHNGGNTFGCTSSVNSAVASEWLIAKSSDPTFLQECRLLEQVEALEDRIFSSSLQVKGWQAPLKAVDDETVHLIARTTPKRSRFEHWPLELAQSRLLELESHIERRYLLPPLNGEYHLDVVPSSTSSNTAVDSPSLDGSDSQTDGQSSTIITTVPDDSPTTPTQLRRVVLAHQQRPSSTDTNPNSQSSPTTAAGLITWRQRVVDSTVSLGTGGVDKLRACIQDLVQAVAWDKSIMKVLCQICRRDNNEAKLLLCDGCDHGYHTYCFRPPITQIPRGDWFCFACISKATNRSHCFVCGQVEGSSASSSLLMCDQCRRSVHPSCPRPPINSSNNGKQPRKWRCANCLTSSAARRGPAIKSPVVVVVEPTLTYSQIGSPCGSGSSGGDRKQIPASKKRRLMKSGDETGSFDGGGGSTSGDSRRSDKNKIDVLSNGENTTTKTLHAKFTASAIKRKGRPASGRPALNKYLAKVGAKSSKIKSSSRPDSQKSPSTASSSNQANRGRSLSKSPGSKRRKLQASSPSPVTTKVPDDSIYEFSADDHNDNDEEEQKVEGSLVEEEEIGEGLVKPTSSPPKIQRLSNAELEWCRNGTEDLIKHHSSWPFRKPVNLKQVPFYRKVIKKPMDLSTIRRKARNSFTYSSLDEWANDVRLIVDNCEVFNEDESEVGRAGHEMRAYFESRWASMSSEPVNTSSPKHQPPSSLRINNTSTDQDPSSSSDQTPPMILVTPTTPSNNTPLSQPPSITLLEQPSKLSPIVVISQLDDQAPPIHPSPPVLDDVNDTVASTDQPPDLVDQLSDSIVVATADRPPTPCTFSSETT